MKKILVTLVSSILLSLAIFSCSSTCGSKKCDPNDKACQEKCDKDKSCCKDKKSCPTEHGKEHAATAAGAQDATPSHSGAATATPTTTPTPGKAHKKK